VLAADSLCADGAKLFRLPRPKLVVSLLQQSYTSGIIHFCIFGKEVLCSSLNPLLVTFLMPFISLLLLQQNC